MDEKTERFRGKRVGRWPGGYVRTTKGGGRVYVLERWLGQKIGKPVRVHVSTGCKTLRAALKELERFELDPLRYRPGFDAAGPGVQLSAELILEYRAHQVAKGLTQEWADEVARCLTAWMEALGAKDLRGLSLHQDILPALGRWSTQRPHRIKALKGLFRWLRETKGLVTRAQDATIDLKVPQARPEKLRRRKVVPPEDVAAVLKHLPAATRDILHLLTATAWHTSEVRRFAAGGEIARPIGAGHILAVLITRHKSGELTKTPLLYPEHVAAAKRIRELKKFPKRMTLARHMRAACKKADVPWFGMGQMRHSVLTWSVEDGGASIKQASEFAQHRSESTTKAFYLDLAVPKNAVPVYRLID